MICLSPFRVEVNKHRDLLFLAPLQRNEGDCDSTTSKSIGLGPNIIPDDSEFPAPSEENWLDDSNSHDEWGIWPGLEPDSFGKSDGLSFEELASLTTDHTTTVRNSEGGQPISWLVPTEVVSKSIQVQKCGVHGPKNTAPVKIRTRRPSDKPKLKPPNPHGRAGKPRCKNCRTRRQGVDNSLLYSIY